jgi:hypothetical protein
VHVKTTTVRQDKKTYRCLSLVESYREGAKMRHRTVARLGEASALASSGQLDRIIVALRTHARGGWHCSDEVEVTGAPGFGAIAAVYAHFSRLGLDADFAALGNDLSAARIADPDLDEQTITVRRALAELGRIRRVTLEAGEQTVTVVTRRNAFRTRLLGAFRIDTKSWSRATMS